MDTESSHMMVEWAAVAYKAWALVKYSFKCLIIRTMLHTWINMTGFN